MELKHCCGRKSKVYESKTFDPLQNNCPEKSLHRQLIWSRIKKGLHYPQREKHHLGFLFHSTLHPGNRANAPTNPDGVVVQAERLLLPYVYPCTTYHNPPAAGPFRLLEPPSTSSRGPDSRCCRPEPALYRRDDWPCGTMPARKPPW